MNDEKIILEVNPRTKEKKAIDLLEYELYAGFTVADLIQEHKELIKEVNRINQLNIKLIDVIASLNKSTAVQIADIKGEIK